MEAGSTQSHTLDAWRSLVSHARCSKEICGYMEVLSNREHLPRSGIELYPHDMIINPYQIINPFAPGPNNKPPSGHLGFFLH